MTDTKSPPRAALRLTALLLAVAAYGCAELPFISADNVCGNGVLEPFNNEDCEPGRPGAYPDGLVCGDADEELACLFVCADDDGEGERIAPCPAGWGCAIEGFCQPPSGRLTEAVPIAGITTPLGIGDFDGDHFPDIAAVQEPLLAVAFGNSSVDYEVTLRAPIDASPNAPVIGDFDGDDREDLVVHAGSRVNIYRGQTDRTVVPLMVPSFGLEDDLGRYGLAAVAMNEPLLRQQVLALELDDELGTLSVYSLTLDDDEEVVITDAGDQLTEHFASADLIGGDGHHELAIARYREQAIVLVSLACNIQELIDAGQLGELEGLECELEEAGEVLAPPGWQLGQAGTFVADINGDGIDDLVFGLQGREGLSIGVALGNGVGLEPAYALPVVRELMGPVMPGAQMMQPPSWLLGVADIDGDGLADLLTGTGVIGAESDGVDTPIRYVQRYRPQREWFSLRMADLNRDGALDLVATTGPSILTLLNAGGGIFNQSETTVESDQIDVHLGDFDGDLFPDLLVLVDGRLLVGFNDGRGLSDELQEAVSLAGNVQTTGFRGARGSTDAIQDVLLIVEDNLGTYGLVLEGSGTRRLSAALELPASVDRVYALHHPSRLSVGLTLEEDMSGERRFRIASAEDLAAAIYEEPPVLELQGDCLPPDGGPQLATTFPDPEGLGYDRAVAVVGQGPDAGPMMGGDGPWTPRILIWDGEDTLDCTALEPSEFAVGPRQVEVADVDGDEAPDLIVVHASERMPGSEDVIEGGLSVYFGDGEGGFDPSPVAVQRQGTARQNGSTASFRGVIAAIDTDSRPGAELAMVFDDGIYLLAADADRTFGDVDKMRNPGVDPPDISSLVALDADLDGVDDLLVSGPRQTVLMRQAPCTPFEAAEGECTRTVNPPEAD